MAKAGDWINITIDGIGRYGQVVKTYTEDSVQMDVVSLIGAGDIITIKDSDIES